MARKRKGKWAPPSSTSARPAPQLGPCRGTCQYSTQKSTPPAVRSNTSQSPHTIQGPRLSFPAKSCQPRHRKLGNHKHYLPPRLCPPDSPSPRPPQGYDHPAPLRFCSPNRVDTRSLRHLRLRPRRRRRRSRHCEGIPSDNFPWSYSHLRSQIQSQLLREWQVWHKPRDDSPFPPFTKLAAIFTPPRHAARLGKLQPGGERHLNPSKPRTIMTPLQPICPPRSFSAPSLPIPRNPRPPRA